MTPAQKAAATRRRNALERERQAEARRRSEAAQRGAETRRRNLEARRRQKAPQATGKAPRGRKQPPKAPPTPKKLTPAQKGALTRRRNLERKRQEEEARRRSEAAKKGARTRRALAEHAEELRGLSPFLQREIAAQKADKEEAERLRKAGEPPAEPSAPAEEPPAVDHPPKGPRIHRADVNQAWDRWVKIAGDLDLIDPSKPSQTARLIVKIVTHRSKGGQRTIHYDLAHLEAFVNDEMYEDAAAAIIASMDSAELAYQSDDGAIGLVDISEDLESWTEAPEDDEPEDDE